MEIDGFYIDLNRGFSVRNCYNREIKKYKVYKYAKEYCRSHPGTYLVYYGQKIEKPRKPVACRLPWEGEDE